MNISHLLAWAVGKYFPRMQFASICVFFMVLAAPIVSATEQESVVTGFHDPLRQTAFAQVAAHTQPSLAVTRAGENLVSVGLRGLIMVSHDQGETWTQSPSPVAVDLVQVYFQNELNGWAVGHDSVLLSTNDGGLSWEVQLDGRSLVVLLKEHYANATDLDEFEAQSMLREVDLGTSTSSDPDIMATPFLDVFVRENGEGFVLGAFGMLLRTTDNGATWEPWTEHTENDRRMHLYSIDVHGDHVYISGEQGLLMELDRDEQRFVQVNTPYTGTFFGVHATEQLLLAYGLRGNLYASRDEGVTWQHVDTQQNSTLVDAVDGVTGEYVMLVSERGELVRIDTRTLDTDLLSIPYTGQVYSSARAGASGEFVVAQFSGLRRIDINQLH
tara:strand:+ start:12385 stop:13539 length:1155 start_codon:yes stop_codon:yes gene_type:complete